MTPHKQLLAQTLAIAQSLLVILGVCLPLTALAANNASTSAIAQGFQASSASANIVAGALVSTKTDSSSGVELATTESTSRLVGVVGQNPLLVISGSAKEVQVVLSGTTNVLVSDINGPIKAGDKITASPIAGVGMLATNNTQIVGVAQTTFDLHRARTQSLTDVHGKHHTVHLGAIPVQIGVAYYQTAGNNFLPPFLQDLANTIAGRPVSIVRILVCTVLLLVGFISIAVLMYSATRFAMIALGRNPLAAANIRKSLYQVIGVAGVVLAGTLLASYLVLTL